MNGLPRYAMADVRRERPTPRRAVAVGEFAPGAEVFATIVERRLPKGDALQLAEIAGIQGAKLAWQWMPLCHPLALEFVAVHVLPVPQRAVVRVYCEAATEARTGVEMEALAGVNAALLTLYDLTKPVEPALTINGVRLLFKEGGKKGLWIHPAGLDDFERATFKPRGIARIEGWRTAVLTASDRAATGQYPDRSGPVLVSALGGIGAEIIASEVLPDDADALATRIAELAATGIGLVMTTGGTGIGPRDCLPEVLARLSTRRVPGLGELFRIESRHHTPLSWLSRAEAVLVGSTLVVALPGKPEAVAQGMAILAPLLAHARAMIDGGTHP